MNPFAPPKADAADSRRTPRTVGAAIAVLLLLAVYHVKAAHYVPLVAWVAYAPSALFALAAASLAVRRGASWYLGVTVAALSLAASAVAVLASDAAARGQLLASVAHVLYDEVELFGSAAALVLLALPRSRAHFRARRRDR
jgi:hypothetical protein